MCDVWGGLFFYGQLHRWDGKSFPPTHPPSQPASQPFHHPLNHPPTKPQQVQYALTSMFVPAPVISLAVKPKQSSMFANFSKALQRFCKEDPTLQVTFDEKTKVRWTDSSATRPIHPSLKSKTLTYRSNLHSKTGNDHQRDGRAPLGNLRRTPEARIQRGLSSG